MRKSIGDIFHAILIAVLVPVAIGCAGLAFLALRDWLTKHDNPAFWCMMVFGAIAVWISWLIIRDANDRSQAKAEQGRLEKCARDRYEAKQKELRSQLASVSALTATTLRELPEILASARGALNKAEFEFEEGAFAPFWDAVETTLAALSRYESSVRAVRDHTLTHAEVAKQIKGDTPSFLTEDIVIPDASTLLDRLQQIVRKGQKVPDFAKIYEMRRTNTILVAGFANLGSALESMGERIHASIVGLAETVSQSISSLSELTADCHRDSLAALKGIHGQLESSAEMLDNIQRRRRPLPEHYRDGNF